MRILLFVCCRCSSPKSATWVETCLGGVRHSASSELTTAPLRVTTTPRSRRIDESHHASRLSPADVTHILLRPTHRALMIEGYDPVLQGLFGTLFTWGVTALGAAIVYLPITSTGPGKQMVLDAMLGFAAGVMVAASFWFLRTLANPVLITLVFVSTCWMTR